jgi:hypothetical protein
MTHQHSQPSTTFSINYSPLTGKIVPNPLIHAGASSITKAKLDAAIKAVKGLSFI